MELLRAVGKTTSRDTRGGRWVGRVTTPASYGDAQRRLHRGQRLTWEPFHMESQPNQRRVTKRRTYQAS